MAFFKRHGRENTFIKILSRFPFDFCYASYVSESQDKAFYRVAKPVTPAGWSVIGHVLLWVSWKQFFYFECILSVQLLSRVGLLATRWPAAHEASLSITNSQSLLRLLWHYSNDSRPRDSYIIIQEDPVLFFLTVITQLSADGIN